MKIPPNHFVYTGFWRRLRMVYTIFLVMLPHCSGICAVLFSFFSISMSYTDVIRHWVVRWVPALMPIVWLRTKSRSKGGKEFRKWLKCFVMSSGKKKTKNIMETAQPEVSTGSLVSFSQAGPGPKKRRFLLGHRCFIYVVSVGPQASGSHRPRILKILLGQWQARLSFSSVSNFQAV